MRFSPAAHIRSFFAKIVAVTMSACAIITTIAPASAMTVGELPDLELPPFEEGPLPFNTRYYIVEFQAPYGATFSVSGGGKLLFDCQFSPYLVGQGVGSSSFQAIDRYPEVRGGVTRDGIHEIRCEVVTDFVPPSDVGSTYYIQTDVRSGDQGVATYWSPWVATAYAQGGRQTSEQSTKPLKVLKMDEPLDVIFLPNQEGIYEVKREHFPKNVQGAKPINAFQAGIQNQVPCPVGPNQTLEGCAVPTGYYDSAPTYKVYAYEEKTAKGIECIPTEANQKFTNGETHPMKPLQQAGQANVRLTVEIYYKRYPAYPGQPNQTRALKEDGNLIWVHEYRHFENYKKYLVDDVKYVFEEMPLKYIPTTPFLKEAGIPCSKTLREKAYGFMRAVLGEYDDAYDPQTGNLRATMPDTLRGREKWKNRRHDIPIINALLKPDDGAYIQLPGTVRNGAYGRFTADSRPGEPRQSLANGYLFLEYVKNLLK